MVTPPAWVAVVKGAGAVAATSATVWASWGLAQALAKMKESVTKGLMLTVIFHWAAEVGASLYPRWSEHWYHDKNPSHFSRHKLPSMSKEGPMENGRERALISRQKIITRHFSATSYPQCPRRAPWKNGRGLRAVGAATGRVAATALLC